MDSSVGIRMLEQTIGTSLPPSVARTLSQDHLNEREGETRGACPYKSDDQSVHITVTGQDAAAAGGCTVDPMDEFDYVCMCVCVCVSKLYARCITLLSFLLLHSTR